MAAVRERPILFSGPMVRAILGDHKTQTRRPLKPQPPSREEAASQPFNLSPRVSRSISFYSMNDYERLPKEPGVFDVSGSVGFVADRCGQREWTCPYGVPGERLWVRETWNALYPVRTDDMPWYHHELDAEGRKSKSVGAPKYIYRECDPENAPTPDDVEVGFRWQPSIFMPRAACRITLAITGVRCERLSEISEADAVAEGVLSLPDEWVRRHWPEYAAERDRVQARNAALVAQGQQMGLTRPPLGPSPRERFLRLWDEINGEGAAARDPYVWVVEFKRVGA